MSNLQTKYHFKLYFQNVWKSLSYLHRVQLYCSVHVINGVYGTEPRSSGGSISSNPQVSAPIPRPMLPLGSRLSPFKLFGQIISWNVLAFRVWSNPSPRTQFWSSSFFIIWYRSILWSDIFMPPSLQQSDRTRRQCVATWCIVIYPAQSKRFLHQ